jgi:hypothetical protein
MTYYHHALDPVLMERTLSFLPANYASFHMKCMHEGCTDGGYDLAPVVAGLVKYRKQSIKGKIFCLGTMPSATPASPTKSIFSTTSRRRLNRNLPTLQS